MTTFLVKLLQKKKQRELSKQRTMKKQQKQITLNAQT